MMLLGKVFDEAVAVVAEQGFVVRCEHLGGHGSGFCRVGDRHWLVVDVAQPTEEQLDILAAAIALQPLPDSVTLSDQLRALVEHAAASTCTSAIQPN